MYNKYVISVGIFQLLCISDSVLILDTKKIPVHAKTLHHSLMVEYDVIFVHLFFMKPKFHCGMH